VWHNGLLLKLHEDAGIHGFAWKWIRSFLTNRSFSIVDNGNKSSPFFTSAGVPQGCVLSPLLFLIYINDLPKVVRSDAKCLLYADDVALHPVLPGLRGHAKLQSALDRVATWAIKWKVVFSQDKSSVVCFNNKKYLIDLPDFNLGATVLKRVDHYKYLGLVFQENGKWNVQFDSLCPRLHKSVFAIQRLMFSQSSPSPTVLLQLMLAPMAQLEYGFAFWRPTDKQRKDILNIIIKPFRNCLALPWYSHRFSILKEFGVPNITSLRYKCILQFANRVMRLPQQHPSQEAWLEDLLTPLPPGAAKYCSPFVSESHFVQLATTSTLPCSNAQILINIMNHDTACFKTSKYGTPLKECRLNFDGAAPYLSSKSLPHIRVCARLRLDVAPLNQPLHKRKLTLSPFCACNPTTLETRSHVLLECPFYNVARSQLVSQLQPPVHLSVSYILDTTSPITTRFILEVNRIRHLIRSY
jgi:hypothetical protein